MARKWWTLIVVCVATFMLLLDITVVNTALPAIRRSLGSSFTDLQWVIDAYALALAAFVLSSGSVADQLGRRRIFVLGLFVFTVASGLCGISTTSLMLNISRGLQGLGGAVMFAVSLALLANAFHGPERAKATAAYGATVGLAVALGPLVGGVLTSALGWPSIFFVNLPLGLLAILITLARVDESRDPRPRDLDISGFITFSGANVLLVLALIRGNDAGWTSDGVLGSLIASGVLFVVFVIIELSVKRPMLPMKYFRNPSFTGAQITAFTLSGSMFALFLYLTLYLQNILHYSPIDAGLIYLPLTGGSMLVPAAASFLMGKVPVRILLSVGLALTAVGLYLMSGVKEGDTWTTLLPGFIVGGLGVGLVGPVLADVALSTVPDEASGVASGINDTFRQVAIAMGVAGLGAVFLSASAHHISTILVGSTSAQTRGLAEAVSGGGLGPAVPHMIVAAARQGFFHGFTLILQLGAGLAALGAVLSLLLVRAKDMVGGGMAAVDVGFGAAPPPLPRPGGSHKPPREKMPSTHRIRWFFFGY